MAGESEKDASEAKLTGFPHTQVGLTPAEKEFGEDFPDGYAVMPTSGENLLCGIRAIEVSAAAQFSGVNGPTEADMKRVLDSDTYKESMLPGLDNSNDFYVEQLVRILGLSLLDLKLPFEVQLGILQNDASRTAPGLVHSDVASTAKRLWIYHKDDHFQGLKPLTWSTAPAVQTEDSGDYRVESVPDSTITFGLPPPPSSDSQVLEKGYKPKAPKAAKPRKYGKGGKVKAMKEGGKKEYTALELEAMTEEERKKVEEAQKEHEKRVDEDDLRAAFALGEKPGKIVFVEDIFGTEVFASDIAYRCTILDNESKRVFDGSFARIVFRVSGAHISFIEVNLGTADIKFKDMAEFKAVLRFPVTSVRAVKFERADLCADAGGEQDEKSETKTTPMCFTLQILEYVLTNTSSENILIPQPHDLIKPLKALLRSGKPLRIHVCGSDVTKANWLALRKTFQELTDPETAKSKNPLAAWIPEGKTQFMVQRGQFIEKGMRPNLIDYKAKNSFIEFDEYVIVNCIGPLEEYEMTNATMKVHAARIYKAYFLEIAGGEDRVYLVLIDMPLEEHVRLAAGDVVKLSEPVYDEGESDRDMAEERDRACHGTVAEPIPGLPGCMLPLHVSRRWDKEQGVFFGFDDVKPVKINQQDDLLQNLEKLRESTPVQVTMDIPLDHKQYKHRVTGMVKFLENLKVNTTKTQALKQVLLGNDVENIPRTDIYASILEAVPKPEEVMGSMNEGQQKAVDLVRRCTGLTANIHGPPGTGKTHLIGELSKPFILANDDQVQILATSASNYATNAIAVRIDSHIREMKAEGLYVVRVHANASESDIARQKARLKRKIPDDAKPQLIQDLEPEHLEVLEATHYAAVIYENYRREHACNVELVPDKRVTEASVEMSVGRRVLQLIGEMKAGLGDPEPNLAEFAELREMYRQYKGDAEFDDEAKAKFKELLTQAREAVLREAVVVCTTPALAVQPKVCTPIADTVKALFVDEASRVPECDSIALFGCYGNIDGMVMVGDPNQLPPTVMHAHTFAEQMTMSLQKRLMANGTESVFLDEQYRMSPNIVAPLNSVIYKGRLKNHPSVESRPVLEELKTFTLQTLGAAKYSLIVDVKNTETEVVPGTQSKYNPIMACVITNIVKMYFDAFPKLTMAIITCYNAQYLLLMAIRDVMAQEDKKYAGIIIVKADSAQGLEYDCCFVDLTMTRGKPGFLKDAHRLTVATSRSRVFSALFMDKVKVWSMHQNALKRICSEYQTVGRRVIVSEANELSGHRTSKYYREKMVDFHNIIDSVAPTQDKGNDANWEESNEQATSADASADADASGW